MRKIDWNWFWINRLSCRFSISILWVSYVWVKLIWPCSNSTSRMENDWLVVSREFCRSKYSEAFIFVHLVSFFTIFPSNKSHESLTKRYALHLDWLRDKWRSVAAIVMPLVSPQRMLRNFVCDAILILFFSSQFQKLMKFCTNLCRIFIAFFVFFFTDPLQMETLTWPQINRTNTWLYQKEKKKIEPKTFSKFVIELQRNRLHLHDQHGVHNYASRL